MRKLVPFLGILLVLTGLLCSCGETPEPTVAEELQLPLNATWDMTAALVDAHGQVLETMELAAKVKAWEQEGEVCYALNFHYPETIYNSVTGVVPDAQRGKPYNCCAGTSVETGVDGKRGPSLYAALDIAKCCFIADFDDEKDIYLIAYKDPNAEVSALWAYFQDFIKMRPAEFPKVYG